MLKVLQLIPTLDRSGAEKQMVLLAGGLPRDRFHVEVATLTRKGPLEAELRAAGVPVTAIGKRLKLDPLALSRLVRFLRAGRFDVLQTWIFAANTYGRIAARLARIPVVVTAEMAVDLWKGRGDLAVDRRLARSTDRVVGNSRAVVDFYRKAGIPDDRLAMIRSGIGDEEPPPSIAPRSRARVRLAGRRPHAPVRRPACAPEGGGRPRQGDRPGPVRPSRAPGLDRRRRAAAFPPRGASARAFRLGGTVHFAGHREDVPRLLAASDLLVLPSLYEGLPNVVLEAMRFRKPVVATAAPGTTEVVADGQTGLLVPLRDPPALAQAIRTIVQDPDRGRRLGAAGRARVESEFRVETMIDGYAALYEELARAKGVM